VAQSRLKLQHQEPEDQAAGPSMVKPVLAEPQSWRKVPILRDGVIARIRWYGREVRCVHTACTGFSCATTRKGRGRNNSENHQDNETHMTSFIA
jgi:hypothetical protein